MAFSGFAEGVQDILEEISFLFNEHKVSLIPYLALFAFLHVFTQYVLPALIPGIYLPLARKDSEQQQQQQKDDAKNDGKAASKPAIDEAKLAVDARSRIVATIFSVHVAILSLYGLIAHDSAALERDVYGSTPLTAHLMRSAVAYFIWDIAVCAIDGYAVEWWIHAVACFCVFMASLVSRGACVLTTTGRRQPLTPTQPLTLACSPVVLLPATHPQRPFLHYMGLVTLLFEASTPFLHARMVLIKTNNTNNRVFPIVQALFALSFFLARIAFGWWKCWGPGQWNDHMNDLLDSGKAHIPAVVRMYQVNCVILSLLNGFWFFKLVQGAVARPKTTGGKGKSA
jgi:hypothetical protein